MSTSRNFRALTRALTLTLVIGLAVVLVACSSSSEAAVTVDGTEIQQAAITREFSTIEKNSALAPQLQQNQGKLPPAVKAAWLTALVESEVAQKVVEADGTKITKVDRQAAQQWASQFFGSESVLTAFSKSFRDSFLDRYANVPAYVRTHTKPPTDADVRESYDGSLSRNCASRRLLSHILVADEAAARSVQAEVVGGGDFKQLAARSSTDSQSGANGGVIGCVDGQQIDPAFAVAAAALPLGGVSAPIKTQYGWHVIKAEDVEQALPFDSVKKEIKNDLIVHGQEGQKKLLALMAKAKVSIPPRLGRWVVKDGHGTVEPPKSAASTTTTGGGAGGGSTGSTSSTTTP
jgi:parvulin-like peptidyl-prolyl isomerase